MVSRKRSAQAKRVADFKAQLGQQGERGGIDQAFQREETRRGALARNKAAALRRKACESKNRYSCESDAKAAIRACEEHGTKGLRAYRCPYCNGWHLTSHPHD